MNCVSLWKQLQGPEAASWGPGQLPRRLQVATPFHLSPISKMSGCLFEDKTRLNRISCLYCSQYLRYSSWETSVYIKKGRTGCPSSQLRGLVVDCAQGQVWEDESESPLILTSIVIPAPDVKGTNSDPFIVKLIWVSNLLARLIIVTTRLTRLKSAISHHSRTPRIAHKTWHGSHLSVSR